MYFKSTYFEDYTIGDKRVTLGRTITETDFVVHAGHTGDFFPHHMDAEWMATQPAGQWIAHGTLILSVAVGMTAGDINPQSMSYGYDRIRFVKPVFLGDTVTVTYRIAEIDPERRRNLGNLLESLPQRLPAGQVRAAQPQSCAIMSHVEDGADLTGCRLLVRDWHLGAKSRHEPGQRLILYIWVP